MLLVSDGVSDQVGDVEMSWLCSTHAAEPQALADALVAAARADEGGYRDKATVVLFRNVA